MSWQQNQKTNLSIRARLFKTWPALIVLVSLFVFVQPASGSEVTENDASFPSGVNTPDDHESGLYIVNLDLPSVGGPEGDEIDQTVYIDQVQETVLSRNHAILDQGTVTTFENIPAFAVQLTENNISQLEADPIVTSVEPNNIKFLQLNQSVPLINADDSHALGFDGSGTAVAIIDSGVDRHPFLNIVSDACYVNAGGFGAGLNTCPDGTYSSTTQGSGDVCGSIPAGCDHGTHVAGIAAGNTNRARVNFISNLSEVGSGNTFEIEIRVTTGPEAISDFNFDISYDDTKVSYVSFAESTGDGFTTTSPTSPGDGSIDISGEEVTPLITGISGMDLVIGTLTFTADAAASDEAIITVERESPTPTFTLIDSGADKPSLGRLKLPIEASDSAGAVDTSASVAYTGVAPAAGIIAIQVFSIFDSATCLAFYSYDPCIGAYDSDIIAGLDHILTLHNDASFTHTIASANMSLGGGNYSSQADCDIYGSSYLAPINNLRSVGIATVVSSGNEWSSSGTSLPGCVSPAVMVGSTTISDTVSGFSNSNSLVELLAPGSGIISSVPDTGFSSFSGTSMAAPHVAGAWAVVKQTNSNATVDEVLTEFIAQGIDILDERNGLTLQRIDVEATVNTLSDLVSTTIIDAGSTESGGEATVQFSLQIEPNDDVTIPLSISDTTEGDLGLVSEITIAATDWDTPANNEITVAGVDDTVYDGNSNYLLITGDPVSTDPVYDSLTAADVSDVSLINTDDEANDPLSSEWDLFVEAELDGDSGKELIAYTRNGGGGKGIGAIFDLDASGASAAKTKHLFTNWSDDWTQLVSIDLDQDGTDELLLYDATSGTFYFYDFNGAIVPAIILSTGTWRVGWDQLDVVEIDATSGPELLFYDETGPTAGRGLFALFQTKPTGLKNLIKQYSTFSNSWSHIVPLQTTSEQTNELLFYSESTGAAWLYNIRINGNFQTLSGSTWKTDWDIILASEIDASAVDELILYEDNGGVGTGQLVMYNLSAKRLGSLIQNYTNTSPDWSFIRSFDDDKVTNDELFFYSETADFSAYYRLNTNGSLGLLIN